MSFERHHDHSQVSGRLIDILDELESAQERMREESPGVTHEETLEPFAMAQSNLSLAVAYLSEAIEDVQQYQEGEVPS